MSKIYLEYDGREISVGKAIEIMDAYAEICESPYIYEEDDEYNPCDGCGGEDCVCCGVYVERMNDYKHDNYGEWY